MRIPLLVFGALLAVAAAPAAPNDPALASGEQWALTGTAGMNVADAWCLSTGTGVLVADIDSGADFSHPDLAGKLIVGARFLGGLGDPAHPDGIRTDSVQDDGGHGTMTAGIIGAATGNGIGIAGVAPDAQVLVIKAVARDGDARAIDLAAGIRFATDHGAAIAYLGTGPEVSIQGDIAPVNDAVAYAAAHGTAVVLPDGNPALASTTGDNVLVVGATGPGGLAAPYSRPGKTLNIYAPGGDDKVAEDRSALVTTTMKGGGYVVVEGTSFAAANAAGALALVIGHGLTATAARQRMLATASHRFEVPLVDARAALGATAGCGSVLGETVVAPPPGQSHAGLASPAPGLAAGITAHPETIPVLQLGITLIVLLAAAILLLLRRRSDNPTPSS